MRSRLFPVTRCMRFYLYFNDFCEADTVTMEMGTVKDFKCRVIIKLSSSTPVMGVEFIPSVRVESCISNEVPPHNLKFTWSSEQITCSVHHSKIATLQCILCERLNLDVQDSYHCTSQCFVDAWKRHLETHCQADETAYGSLSNGENALKELKDCLLWPLYVPERTQELNGKGKSLVRVGTSRTYIPSSFDVGTYLMLKCVAVDSVTCVPLSQETEVITDAVIIAPTSAPRTLVHVGYVKNMEELTTHELETKAGHLRVLSYNILADMLAQLHNNDHCDSWAIVWPYRRQNLLREIIGYKADVICLQEVQSDHYESFFKPWFTHYGYKAVYKKKRNDLYSANQYYADGCATFYHCDKCKEIKTYELEFEKTAKSVVDSLGISQRQEGAIRLMKDNVAVIMILEMLGDDEGPGARVCVANTHLNANTKSPDVKCCQVAQLLKGLQTIAELQIPVLICGDLNSRPGSDPYKLIVNGELQSDGHTVDPLNIYQYLDLQHSMHLASAYSSLCQSAYVDEREKRKMNPSTMEPRFTHWSKRSPGTLDYIFYSVDDLVVESVLELLDEQSVGKGIPSPLYSSDHIALMAEFSFKPSPSPRRPCPTLPSNPWL